MKFQCLDCGRQFHYAAKLIQSTDTAPAPFAPAPFKFGAVEVKGDMLESMVCPYCKHLNFDEVKSEAVQPEAVQVIDLISGANPAIDALLAEGWVVAARYAKQYILEKPRMVEGDYVEAAKKLAEENSQ